MVRTSGITANEIILITQRLNSYLAVVHDERQIYLLVVFFNFIFFYYYVALLNLLI